MSKAPTASTNQPRRRLSAPERRARIESAATELFGTRGFAEASIDQVARAAGITPPVLYEHFPSKLALYEAVLETHFAKLRQIWHEQFAGRDLSTTSVADSFDAWFAYVETNPAAARVLFREPTASDAAAVQRAISDRSRDLILSFFVGLPGAARLAESKVELEMRWIVMRSVLQGLALWWLEHPEVERERIVSLAVDSLWNGYKRSRM